MQYRPTNHAAPTDFTHCGRGRTSRAGDCAMCDWELLPNQSHSRPLGAGVSSANLVLAFLCLALILVATRGIALIRSLQSLRQVQQSFLHRSLRRQRRSYRLLTCSFIVNEGT